MTTNEIKEELTQQFIFISGVLKQLQAEIQAGGIVEEYQNGQNQKGVKVSASLQAYITATKKLLDITKQLKPLLEADEINEMWGGLM